MIWCPYLGVEVHEDNCTPEHIIPMSLGGSNGFTVPVDSYANTQIGSEVDAGLATDDHLIRMRRRNFDARGHSNKPVTVMARSATYGAEKRFAQVTFAGEKGIQCWDPRHKRQVPDQELINYGMTLCLVVRPFARIRFVAKVALSAGYEIYGDLFKETADHAAVRALMNAKSAEEAAQSSSEDDLRGFFEFWSGPEDDSIDTNFHRALCESVGGSLVLTRVIDGGIIFIVGILGQWVGTLNVPANVENYPVAGMHDCGHAVLLVGKKTERISGRDFMQRVLDNLPVDDSVEESQGGF